MRILPRLENAFLLIRDGLIEDYGVMEDCPDRAKEVIDASGKMVLPCWCDSHTHIVFAASREKEFEMRLKGKSYEEIAAEGGGILNSARRLQDTSEEELFDSAWKTIGGSSFFWDRSY